MTLTTRERRILKQLSSHGLSDKGIAESTGLPLNAVKTSVRSLCKRLGFGGPDKSPRVQLAMYGCQNGFGREGRRAR